MEMENFLDIIGISGGDGVIIGEASVVEMCIILKCKHRYKNHLQGSDVCSREFRCQRTKQEIDTRLDLIEEP